ncbi:MAG: D-alanyl-D-alanine carboxypeptidase, partial [Ruaniaceae bacterium]|nr:D-alanyl-D-alanine carboxypeptidase [Ruaniaceae bacterium]
MGKRLIAALTATTLVLGGAYLTLDVLDIAPGVLTSRPAIPDPAPYPHVVPAERSAPELLSSASPAPAGDVNAAVDSFVTSGTLGGLVGVTVIDGASGDVIADNNGSVPMPPASSTKVLTAAATLSTLGPATRLAT